MLLSLVNHIVSLTMFLYHIVRESVVLESVISESVVLKSVVLKSREECLLFSSRTRTLGRSSYPLASSHHAGTRCKRSEGCGLDFPIPVLLGS